MFPWFFVKVVFHCIHYGVALDLCQLVNRIAFFFSSSRLDTTKLFNEYILTITLFFVCRYVLYARQRSTETCWIILPRNIGICLRYPLLIPYRLKNYSCCQKMFLFSLHLRSNRFYFPSLIMITCHQGVNDYAKFLFPVVSHFHWWVKIFERHIYKLF